jgi:HK97 family phage major capsid protein
MNLSERIIENKQERANVYDGIKAILNEFENKEMDQIKKEELSKLEAKFDNLNESILSNEKNLERERAIGERESVSTKTNNKDEEIKNAFENYLKTGTQSSYEIYNALQQDNPTQAGYLVSPQKFVGELIKELDNTMFLRQKAKVLPALQGAQSLGYPTRTARMGAAVWGTEIAAPTADTTLAFGKREFKPNPATAEILISKTLIRNAPGVEGIVRDEIAFAFAELLETAYMTGNGVIRPLGLFTASVDGIPVARDVSTGNTATEMKFDGLMEAKYSVKNQYQARCEWIFNRVGVKQLAKLKDSDGQYIWQPSVVMGTPDMLLGKPVNMSEYAPSTFTTGLYVGLYGDLMNYWICDSLAMEITALFELYARTNQVDYIARIETDGAPVVSEAFARVKLG